MARRRFALVGAGLFGEMHARAYRAHPEAELAVVCDVNRARAREVAQRYGAGRFCTDWREVALDAEIAAASVATPDFAHTEIAVGLARAGKHLLVEKPLAMTEEECEQIIAAAREAGVKLMVDFHNRWSPPLATARRMIESGELGVPRFVYFRLSNTTAVPLKMLPWAGESSVLWFLGSHAVDAASWLIGEWPHRAFSVSRREVLKGRGVDTPDLYQSVLEYPGGAVASIENCWLLSESAPSVFDLKCELVATEGTVYIDTSSSRVMEVQGAEGVRRPDVMGAPLVHGSHLGFMLESIKHFADCVIHGGEPLVPGEVGFEVTRIARAIERSAEMGQPVEIAR